MTAAINATGNHLMAIATQRQGLRTQWNLFWLVFGFDGPPVPFGAGGSPGISSSSIDKLVDDMFITLKFRPQ